MINNPEPFLVGWEHELPEGIAQWFTETIAACRTELTSNGELGARSYVFNSRTKRVECLRLTQIMEAVTRGGAPHRTDEEYRDILASVTRDAASDIKADAYLNVAEAWMVLGEADAQRYYQYGMRPSQNPNRVEVISIMLELGGTDAEPIEGIMYSATMGIDRTQAKPLFGSHVSVHKENPWFKATAYGDKVGVAGRMPWLLPGNAGVGDRSWDTAMADFARRASVLGKVRMPPMKQNKKKN